MFLLLTAGKLKSYFTSPCLKSKKMTILDDPMHYNQNPGNLRMVGKLAEVGAGQERATRCYWVKQQENHCKAY